jgi:uncharacterized protein (TIGR00730 family)
MPKQSQIKLSRKDMTDISFRAFRIMSEFVEGFEFLTQFKKEVSIFGSARFGEDNKWYKEAQKLGELLARGGYTVITGGGPGIMEGGNRGAHSVNPGKSVGINIELPTEQRTNPYVDKSKGFYYFFTRKVMLAASAQAYIFFPGGFGTVDEFMELTMLIQTKKMQKIPIVLVGKEFWQPFLNWIDNTLLKKYKAIKPEDTKLYKLVNTAEEALKIVKTSKDRKMF